MNSICSANVFLNFMKFIVQIQIEFQDPEKSGEDVSVCWKTCSLIYPNTTLALISKTNSNRIKKTNEENEGKLICHCALGNAIDNRIVGPGNNDLKILQ